jgi:hypothetical protein
MPIITEPKSRSHSETVNDSYESTDPKTASSNQNSIAAAPVRIAFIRPGLTLKDCVRTIVALVAHTSEHNSPTISPSEIEIKEGYGERGSC